MAAHGVYHLDVRVQPEWSSPKFVGLLKGRTGVPVCLLYLRGSQIQRVLELHSLEDVENEILKSDNAWDREAWKSCLPFFEAEGELLHVAALPVSGSIQTRLSEMLGHDHGIRSRTGIHVLKSFTEFADTVVVPQASQILSGGEHRAFYQRLVDEIGKLEHYFFIIDFPKHFSQNHIEAQWRGFHSSDCAAYAPWVMYKGVAYTPGLSVAAMIQQNDADNGISDLPANRPLKGRPVPLYTLNPREVRRMQELRVNVFQEVGKDDIRIWGGLTMSDACDSDSKFITSRRALLAVKTAVEEICAPFVMEPLREDSLPSRVEANLTSIFARVTKLFDPDAKTPFLFKVGVSPIEGEDVLVVDMKYWVPYALNEVSLSLGVNA